MATQPLHLVAQLHFKAFKDDWAQLGRDEHKPAALWYRSMRGMLLSGMVGPELRDAVSAKLRMVKEALVKYEMEVADLSYICGQNMLLPGEDPEEQFWLDLNSLREKQPWEILPPQEIFDRLGLRVPCLDS